MGDVLPSGSQGGLAAAHAAPAVTARARVMVIAPHPDDETLGAGGILQRAVGAGAAVRVLFATDGENNPWPQRVLERRWRIGAGDRSRWGTGRRGEALAALRALGVGAGSVDFLGLPDQGITEILLQHDAPHGMLVHAIRDWRPTLLVGPSVRDLHPDHSALAVLIELAVATLPAERRCARLSYLIHGPTPPATVEFPLRPVERIRKDAAIRCHVSQLLFHRRSYGRRADTERFVIESTACPDDPHRSVRAVRVDDLTLHLDLALHGEWPGIPMRLHLIGLGPEAIGARWTASLPRSSGPICLRDARTNTPLARAGYARSWGSARVAIPRDAIPGSTRVFVKVERRALFFDVAGWTDVPLAPVRAPETWRRPARIGRLSRGRVSAACTRDSAR